MRRRFVLSALILAGSLGLGLGPGGLAQPAAAQLAVAAGTLAVTNSSGNAVSQFAASANGNATPIRTITGAATGLDDPIGLGYDSLARLYVSNFNSNSVTVYAAGAKGNVAPIRTITGGSTLLSQPFGLAVTPSGAVWVANFGNDSLVEFAPGASGNVAPVRAIAGSSTGLFGPLGVALTADGQGVWVTDNTSPRVVREFSTQATGNVAPVTSISGSNTGFSKPYGLATSLGGRLFFTDAGSERSFSAGAHGNVAPSRSVTGPNTQLTDEELLGIDAVGNVWVANTAATKLLRFGPTANGNVAPSRAITGAATGLDGPFQVAIYTVPPGAPKLHGTAKVHRKHHKKIRTLTLSWKAPATTGGGIEGYVVRTRPKAHGAWNVVTVTTKRAFHKAKAKPGFYDVLAFNERGLGTASHAFHVKA